MRHIFLTFALALLAACDGRSTEEQLREAANQSDPAAAEVLKNAAETGVPPQEALEQAGQAAAQANADAGPPSGSVQARPNLPGQPNPPQPGQPPEKIVVNRQ